MEEAGSLSVNLLVALHNSFNSKIQRPKSVFVVLYILMAQTNYLIDGLSGTGKTTICKELVVRGYNAVDADSTFSHFIDPVYGKRTDTGRHEDWSWDEQAVTATLEDKTSSVLFICGGGRNSGKFRHYFKKVFNLRIDESTLRTRLKERTNNNFGKKPEELETMLKLHRQNDKPKGSIDIDAARPLSEVVDEIIAHALP